MDLLASYWTTQKLRAIVIVMGEDLIVAESESDREQVRFDLLYTTGIAAGRIDPGADPDLDHLPKSLKKCGRSLRSDGPSPSHGAISTPVLVKNLINLHSSITAPWSDDSPRRRLTSRPMGLQINRWCQSGSRSRPPAVGADDIYTHTSVQSAPHTVAVQCRDPVAVQVCADERSEAPTLALA